MSNPIEVGDQVAYSTAFLKSTGQHTGSIPFARGMVMSIKGIHTQIAEVNWNDEDIPPKVNTKNLVRVSDIHKESV